MTRLAVLFAAVVLLAAAILAAAPAHADPDGPGIGQCSFQGEYFVQYYPCDQPPAWLLLPHSSDERPGAGTTAGAYG